MQPYYTSGCNKARSIARLPHYIYLEACFDVSIQTQTRHYDAIRTSPLCRSIYGWSFCFTLVIFGTLFYYDVILCFRYNICIFASKIGLRSIFLASLITFGNGRPVHCFILCHNYIITDSVVLWKIQKFDWLIPETKWHSCLHNRALCSYLATLRLLRQRENNPQFSGTY